MLVLKAKGCGGLPICADLMTQGRAFLELQMAGWDIRIERGDYDSFVKSKFQIGPKRKIRRI